MLSLEWYAVMSKYGARNLGTIPRQDLDRKVDQMDGSGSEWATSDDEPAGTTQFTFDNYISSLEKSQQKHDGQGDAISVYSSEVEEVDPNVAPAAKAGGKTASKHDASKKRKLIECKKESFDDSDDGEDVYAKFKNRRSVQRRQAAASTKRAKAQAKGASIVGKRTKTVVDVKEQRERGWKTNGTGEVSEDDENEEELEKMLPDYLNKRRDDFERKVRRKGNHGLALPPLYSDICFSEDERDTPLEIKPKLKGIKPQRAYEDIHLQSSAGTIPAPIAQYLRSYQIDGAAFMHERFIDQQGGILGDDMGLGKTIQIIAFLTAVFGKTGDIRDAKRMRKIRRMDEGRWYPRVLLICPGSIIANWQQELEKWGWWEVGLYHGTKGREATIAQAVAGRLEIMITTYDTYRVHESSINGVWWDCVVADEMHKCKERKAEMTKAMLKVNSLCRIGLTGTAVQNKYEELWTLLNWTNPGVLGSMASWKVKMCLPLKYGQAHGATNAQIATARSTALKLKNNLLPRFFLRRPKSLIADELPKKTDRIVFCPLTAVQAEAYNTFVDADTVSAARNANNPCHCLSGRKQGWCCEQKVSGRKWSHFVFPALFALQSIANHIALLLPVSESPEKHDKELERLEMALPDCWKDLYRQKDSITHFANTEFCGKWAVLKKLLHFWHSNGDKVLVFSHSVRLLKMLKMLFSSKTHYIYSYLDGSMSYQDRQKAVDEYNASPSQFVFLISTKAGGMGLNITSANKVVVVDPNWNPSYDLQAQDRAYRIGQTRDVEVFRLVSAGTIEEIVYARQIYKQQQASIAYDASVERRYFRGVQDQREMKGEIFGLANIFAPQSDNVVLRDIVNKTNVAESRAGVEIAGLDFEAAEDEAEDLDALYMDATEFLNDKNREEAAIKSLAANIIEDPDAVYKRGERTVSAKRRDPVQAILASVGVEYTHNNAEVIGTSRMETKISSRACKVGNDLDFGGEFAFVSSQPGGNKKEKGGAGDGEGDGDYEHEDDDDDDEGFNDGVGSLEGGRGGRKYRFNPPEDVRKRQLCSMAGDFGFDDPVEFGLVVEEWTQGQRRDALERWYGERRRRLKRED